MHTLARLVAFLAGAAAAGGRTSSGRQLADDPTSPLGLRRQRSSSGSSSSGREAQQRAARGRGVYREVRLTPEQRERAWNPPSRRYRGERFWVGPNKIVQRIRQAPLWGKQPRPGPPKDVFVAVHSSQRDAARAAWSKVGVAPHFKPAMLKVPEDLLTLTQQAAVDEHVLIGARAFIGHKLSSFSGSVVSQRSLRRLPSYTYYERNCSRLLRWDRRQDGVELIQGCNESSSSYLTRLGWTSPSAPPKARPPPPWCTEKVLENGPFVVPLGIDGLNNCKVRIQHMLLRLAPADRRVGLIPLISTAPVMWPNESAPMLLVPLSHVYDVQHWCAAQQRLGHCILCRPLPELNLTTDLPPLGAVGLAEEVETAKHVQEASTWKDMTRAFKHRELGQSAALRIIRATGEVRDHETGYVGIGPQVVASYQLSPRLREGLRARRNLDLGVHMRIEWDWWAFERMRSSRWTETLAKSAEAMAMERRMRSTKY
eukprot:TRINITY_DN43116_c2_g3_i1.p1 TRINITY_DN43116_c2_g3~~TRINITY_DN43116_c2_g3_i1.p1  ORF type:complete len:509 (+),score=75.86 TRINITY_DN43116_c2_g3_i1:78-1529(+)